MAPGAWRTVNPRGTSHDCRGGGGGGGETPAHVCIQLFILAHLYTLVCEAQSSMGALLPHKREF